MIKDKNVEHVVRIIEQKMLFSICQHYLWYYCRSKFQRLLSSTMMKKLCLFCRMRYWRQLLWNMGRISGHELRRCCTASRVNNARLVGSSGLIQASRRQSGVEKRRKNCCIWPSWCRHSGERSLRSLDVLRPSVWSTTNTCCEHPASSWIVYKFVALLQESWFTSLCWKYFCLKSFFQKIHNLGLNITDFEGILGAEVDLWLPIIFWLIVDHV